MTYTVNTLAKLYSLDRDRLVSLIASEGVTVFDVKNLTKVGYIPTLNDYFKLDSDLEKLTYKNVKEDFFDTTMTNEILTVVSKNSAIPVTAYLFSEMYDQLDSGGRKSILIPPLPGKKLFIGDTVLMRRLSQGISNDYAILPFIKEGVKNEQLP